MKQSKGSLLRFFTLCLFFLMLLYAFHIALKGTSQSHFDIPEDRKVYVLPTHAPTPIPSPSPDPLALFRQERENRFNEITGILNLLANDTSVSAQIRTLSHEKLTEYTESERITLLIESALQGMGYPDAVCAVQGKTASVFLSVPIKENEGQLLTDLIREWTGWSASSVRLIETP